MNAERLYGMRTRVSPDLDLNKIVVHLNEDTNLPRIEIHGTIKTGNRRFDQVSDVTITTAYMPPATRAFVEEMKRALLAGRNPTAITED